VKEQSHKDEMSAAIRGDFQRLRERGVAVSLAPVEHESDPKVAPPDEAPVDPPEPEPEPAPIASAQDEADVEPAEPVRAAEPSMNVVDEADPPRPGWLGRLLGR
jgi:hypothetical protein